MSTTEFLSINKDTQDFFYSILEQASSKQQLLLSPFLLHYLSSVLSHYGHGASLGSGESIGQSLSDKYTRAIAAGSPSRGFLLKQVAEESLYSLGFFSSFFKKKILGVNYYMELGAHAYHSLSTLDQSEEHREVFAYCSENFLVFSNLFHYLSKNFLHFPPSDQK